MSGPDDWWETTGLNPLPPENTTPHWLSSEEWALVQSWRRQGALKQARLVWLAHHGPMPPYTVVSHVNGDRFDNRIENLELVTMDEIREKGGL